jgi:UDP:flavonoid glycosyltransferase YjiC (YdhE family)
MFAETCPCLGPTIPNRCASLLAKGVVAVRFLFTTVPGAGHLFPLVPLAWSLRSSGHEILLATAGPGTVFGPGAGLTTVDVAPGLEVEAIAATLHDSGQSEHGDLPPERAIALFTAVSHEMLDGTRRCAELWSPDVVIYESMHGAGAVVAAQRGIPAVEHAVIWVAPPGALVSAIYPALTDGAPYVPAIASIGIAPPSLAPAPDPGWAMRPVPYSGGAVVPDDALAAPQKPRVLITMGTVVSRNEGVGLLRELVNAIAQEPIEVLVALGGDPAQLGPLPESVRAHRWLPLTAALPQCAAVVHHGGAGTCLAALAAGVPQVILPQAADQFLNTDSLVTRGCALRSTGNPDELRSAVRAALSGALDGPVAQVRREIAQMPPPPSVADDLVTLLSR